MALRVKFIDGIESMSGTMDCGNGQRMTITHRKSDKPGEGHARIWRKGDYKRKTEVGESELARRRIFALANKKIAKDMKDPSLVQMYQEDYKIAKGIFNGKKYATLRGFAFAQMYDAMLQHSKVER